MTPRVDFYRVETSDGQARDYAAEHSPSWANPEGDDRFWTAFRVRRVSSIGAEGELVSTVVVDRERPVKVGILTIVQWRKVEYAGGVS